jgi:hypothetical protein
MIWTIFIIVIFIGIISFSTWNYLKNGLADEFWQLFGTSAVIGLLLWFFGMLLGTFWLAGNSPLKKVVYLKEKVYSLDITNGSQTISGSFFLGCGGFSSRGGIKYLMFHSNEGGKELLEVDASNTIIYEDEDKNPYIIRKAYYEYDFSKQDLWFHHLGKNKWKHLDKYKLHVPKNTIKINPMEIDISKLK